MRRLALGAAWASAAVAAWAFFLPWMNFSVRGPSPSALQALGRVTLEVRQGDRTLKANLADLSRLPPQVSGADIPRLVRDKQAQTGLMVLELVTGHPQHAEARSLAVYAVPGLALLGAAALTLAGRRPVALSVAIAALGIAGAGAWKLSVAPAASSAVAVAIQPGLWLSVGAYVGLAASAAIMSIRAKGA